MHIRMGTRGSALALAQCNEVKALLEKAYPQHSFEICVITTKGDRIQHVALDQMKDKGIFVKEIEQQLLEHTIDLAVHSMKDMPSVLDERLCFTETLLREDARDVLVLRNIETRLKKLEDQQLDGIVLAAAGLKRLQLAQYITQTLPEHIMVPAVAQGAIAIEVHKKRNDLVELVNALCTKRVDEEVCAERAFLQELNGGCHTPLGARCILHEADAELFAVYGSEDGARLFDLHVSGPRAQAQAMAIEAAQRLRKKVEEGL